MPLSRSGKDHLLQHPGLLSALGLGPLAAKSSTLTSGVCLGLVFVAVLWLSSLTVLPGRRYFPYRYLLAFILLITATWTSLIDMGLHAFFFQMRLTLDVYIPLVAVNALLLAFLEQNALSDAPAGLWKNAGTAGATVFLIVTVMGLLRELLGQGSVLTDIQVFPQGLAVFNSSAGAFIILGCLMALLNFVLKPRAGSLH